MRRLKIWMLLILVTALLIPLVILNGAHAAIIHCVEPQIAGGGHFTVGLRMDGTLVTVGDNSYGQRNVGGWSEIVQVAAGYYHTVGIKSNGAVVAIGKNNHGQCNVGGWSDIIQIRAGYDHTVGLKSNGAVVAIGINWRGQCDVGGWSDITQVAAGSEHTVGLRSDGTAVATGYNAYGQCDVGSWTSIVQVTAGRGGDHTVGLRSDGTVVAVGSNNRGQCNVSGWSNIAQVVAGGEHTVGLRSDGTVVAIGKNSQGQCNVGSWSDIVQVAAGDWHTLGLRSNGTVVATGLNWKGQCNVGGWDLFPTYEDGYQAGLDYCSPIIADLEGQLEDLLTTYLDITAPSGSIHAHDNMLWPPSNRMVEVTLSGYVRDELSIARDGGGIGVSEAYLLVNGEETIPLVPDSDGKFTEIKALKATKDAVYTIELYAADTNPDDSGGPNSGLVDQTYVRVPSNVGK